MAAFTSRLFNIFTRGINLRKYCTNAPVEFSPLMVQNVLELLNLKDNDTVLDMTFGDGLHTEAILKSNESVKVIALDRDPFAIEKAEALALKYPGRVQPLLGRFSDLPALLPPIGIKRNTLDAVMFDLGCSSIQLNDASRGFSPEVDGPLDMRMDGPLASSSITAYDILTKADEQDLGRILKTYGSEENSKKLARSLIACRYTLEGLASTGQLKEFLKGIFEEKSGRVIKNVFYALRTFVNNEFNELNFAILFAQGYLKEGGRMVSLTFNQLEDTIVKRHITGNVLENSPNPMPFLYYSQTFKLSQEEMDALRRSVWTPLSKHVITPVDQYKSTNHRIRNAKLRGAVRL
ncbi:putative methyltransferase-like protein 15-like protein [Frankliniella fusca]|uniref:Methyltransferase-like protein 15-like protein n=1 Tax=Frankliniella fusca TaxID=407009 RepID=A0AAE1HEF6_9NEOP|nr:putative methyltransferase-like protein 15-like protein [Frankliniella fusca]